FRANKVAPYEKIIRLVNEDRLTLREISKKFNLTKDICSIFNEQTNPFFPSICIHLSIRLSILVDGVNTTFQRLCAWVWALP
ncbi:hypothetical protein, partial [Hallella multisaccharivorax]|uniref:hypothetical protein n=1 Tax=Hallella multisaccharivorax TaxID=310514 RepID=UPI003619BB64